MLRSRLFLTLVSAALAAIPLFVGCSNQGEGERCAVLNNSDDCQEGLTCVAGFALNPPQNSDICCPGNRQVATTTVCLIPGGDAAIPNAPPDGGAGDAPATDTSTAADTSTSDAPAGDATTE